MNTNLNEIGVDEKFIKDISNFQLEYYNELISKRGRIQTEISKITNKITELKALIEQKEGNVDVNYDFFSPNTNEQNLQKEKYNSQINNLNIKLEKFKQKYEEIDNIINKFEMIEQYIQMLTKRSNNNLEENSNLDDENRDEKNENPGLYLLNIQEIERQRIARDLHDSTVQNLTNLVHKAELCTKLIDMDVIRTKLELHTMISTIRNIINEMRSIIYDLRPMSLDDIGLVVTVERYILKIKESSDIKVKLKVVNDEVNILSLINLTLFRIIQEACNNAIKHSGAQNILINIIYNESNIDLEIEDDGIGFEYIENDNSGGNSKQMSFGLSIMKERVLLLSGSMEIITKENLGTKIKISVPFDAYMEENDVTN